MRRTTIERLTRYHLCLSESANWSRSETFSSDELAALLDIDPTQIRRDLARIGVRGRPNSGYLRQAVLDAVRASLGFGELRGAVIVGANRLGCALAEHPTFDRFGLSVVAIFDDDEELIGRIIGGATVFPLHALQRETRRLCIRLGIITHCDAMPPKAAASALVDAGVMALWNFSSVTLRPPPGVVIRQEQLSIELAELAYFVRRPLPKGVGSSAGS